MSARTEPNKAQKRHRFRLSVKSFAEGRTEHGGAWKPVSIMARRFKGSSTPSPVATAGWDSTLPIDGKHRTVDTHADQRARDGLGASPGQAGVIGGRAGGVGVTCRGYGHRRDPAAEGALRPLALGAAPR